MMSLVRMLTSLGRTHRPDHGHVNHEVHSHKDASFAMAYKMVEAYRKTHQTTEK